MDTLQFIVLISGIFLLRFLYGRKPITMKYEQVYDEEWIEPTPQTGHKMACCDCGLVHTIDFRIVNGKVQFKAVRDNRATGQRRRKINKTKSPKI